MIVCLQLGTLPLHLAFAKQQHLVALEKVRLTERKAAELAAYKFHQEGFDASKLKAEMKEADDNAASKVAVHEDLVKQVAANGAVMGTLLKATFEVLVPQGIPPEASYVEKGVHAPLKEKVPLESWLSAWEEAVGKNKKENPAKEKDKLGNLPLHRAILKKSPLGAVEAILRAWPEAITVGDGGEFLPLHLAVSAKVSENVVKKLLEAHPGAAKETEKGDERLPLHIACEKMATDGTISTLLITNFEGARVADKKGHLPLHYAAEHPTSEFVMGALLMASPDAPRAKANDGSLPLHRAAKRQAPASVVHALLKAFPDAAKAVDVRGCLALHWAVGKHAPEEIVRSLLEANSDGCQQADNDGNLPLHLAIEYEASDAVITMLIDQYPGATRAVNRNKKVRFLASDCTFLARVRPIALPRPAPSKTRPKVSSMKVYMCQFSTVFSLYLCGRSALSTWHWITARVSWSCASWRAGTIMPVSKRLVSLHGYGNRPCANVG